MTARSDTPITDLFESLLESADVPREVMLKACRAAERAALEAARCSGGETALLHKRREIDRRRAKENREKTKKTSTDSPKPENALFLTSGNIDSVGKDSEKKERALVIESADSKKRKATKLPDDWQPNSKHYDLAAELRFTELDVLKFAREMRDWTVQEAHRPITKKANWDMAFSGWMRRAAQKHKPNGRGPDNGPSMADIASGRFL